MDTREKRKDLHACAGFCLGPNGWSWLLQRSSKYVHLWLKKGQEDWAPFVAAGAVARKEKPSVEMNRYYLAANAGRALEKMAVHNAVPSLPGYYIRNLGILFMSLTEYHICQSILSNAALT